MITNLERYKEDLKKLIVLGDRLLFAMLYQSSPEEFVKLAESEGSKDPKSLIKSLPNFSEDYQGWYSEAKVLIKQILPDRLDDFVRHYEKPKSRKEITFENYHIEDNLQGLIITQTSYGEKTTIVDTSAGVPRFRQQLAIVRSVSARFESSLFDIKQLVQADLFDSELNASRELLKKGFVRGAGAMAGVILEAHLKQVCGNHKLSSRRKRPSISDLNDLLKTNSIVDVPDWRRIQRLGDLRNLCDHSKDRDPNSEEVDELISGVDWATHTLF